ncbi:MAG TPA: PEGA domain-containing protein [Steroidobacteraceae bacterium]|nr:PEGA domain-containing protein [Steroidobacteraceae bacterium]
MRAVVLITLACLSACSWFGSHRPRPSAQSSELVVTGAPAGSTIYVDGVQTGQVAAHNDQSQILDVPPGAHKVEIHVNEAAVYREDTYVGPGERRVVTVLSGSGR